MAFVLRLYAPVGIWYTYTRGVLMAFVLRLYAPVGIWYTGLPSHYWRSMDSPTCLCCSTVVLRALCVWLGIA